MKKVTILAGISGSGKSTLAKAMQDVFDSTRIVSTDHYFMFDGKYKFDASMLHEAHATCLRNFVAAITSKADRDCESLHIIVDNTNTTVAEIAPYASLALAYGYRLEILIVVCAVTVALNRGLHGVPAFEIRNQARRLQELRDTLPFYWESRVRVIEPKQKA